MHTPSPATAVPGYVALAGVLGAVVALFIIFTLNPPTLLAAPLFLVSCAIPMWVIELKRISVEPRKVHSEIPIWRRTLRLTGLIAVLILFTASWAVFRVFSPGPISGLEPQLIILIPLTAAWMAWITLRPAPRHRLDSIEILGRTVLRISRNGKPLNSRDIQCILGWLVKVFFLPLMLSSTYIFLASASSFMSDGHGSWWIFSTSYALLFAVDTAFATIGYCSTSRRIDAHIRSTEPTVAGWVVALVCYPPLNAIILHQWLSYHDGYDWEKWLSQFPIVCWIWGLTILIMTGLYVSATVAFGPRFSNLTNRGIITSGPYRYFKHPSYIGKNAAWWLMSVPFVSDKGPLVVLTSCTALLAINGLYLLRAKTEEIHLMRDPDYRAYAHWIDEHGVLGKVKKFLRIRMKLLA
ncbi:MAG: isoprenylcysteine carboxylmethyltransferase family protein [Lysobacter sp.]